MENNDRGIALSVKNVSITYKVVHPVKFSKLFRKDKDLILPEKKMKAAKGFKAVKDVSFDIAKGEIVGMIGKNGSGKSTLLRALAHIYDPDTGEIDTFGHSVSLMAIGVGFVPNLSGRVNIYLSGMLMGLNREEIDGLIDEIIEFSELGSFIDAPVSSYSSGMHSKLAFSISSIIESDIMLVDETLSVGDRRFRKKSERKMRSLIQDEEKTVLIVSHNLDTLRELCGRVIWLDDGMVRMDGPTEEVLNAYIDSVDKNVM